MALCSHGADLPQAAVNAVGPTGHTALYLACTSLAAPPEHVAMLADAGAVSSAPLPQDPSGSRWESLSSGDALMPKSAVAAAQKRHVIVVWAACNSGVGCL